MCYPIIDETDESVLAPQSTEFAFLLYQGNHRL